jgi:NADPH:quinone reductase-like Zn-dependent oxidoreductase
MRIVDAPQPGGPEALVVREVPQPSLPPSHVLIRVAAAGLNRADILQRRGQYPSPPGAPSHPGLESGERGGCDGADVNESAVGDPGVRPAAGGGYAEYCAALVDRRCTSLPASISWTPPHS